MAYQTLFPIRPASPQAQREVRRDTPIRRARTCYGHLAGVIGVQLMDELLGRGWLEPLRSAPDSGRIHYVPTAEGKAALAERGVAVPVAKGRLPIAFSCIDWTERRPHLGGALGRALVAALLANGGIERTRESRVVTLAGDLRNWLDG